MRAKGSKQRCSALWKPKLLIKFLLNETIAILQIKSLPIKYKSYLTSLRRTIG